MIPAHFQSVFVALNDRLMARLRRGIRSDTVESANGLYGPSSSFKDETKGNPLLASDSTLPIIPAHGPMYVFSIYLPSVFGRILSAQCVWYIFSVFVALNDRNMMNGQMNGNALHNMDHHPNDDLFDENGNQRSIIKGHPINPPINQFNPNHNPNHLGVLGPNGNSKLSPEQQRERNQRFIEHASAEPIKPLRPVVHQQRNPLPVPDPNGKRLPISNNPIGHQINGHGMNAGFKPRLLPLQPQRPLPELPASLTANTENAVVTIPQNDHYGFSQQSPQSHGSSNSMRMTPLQNRNRIIPQSEPPQKRLPIAKEEPAGPLPPKRKVKERRPPESQTKKAEPKITKKQPRKALPDHPPNHPENKKKQNGNDDARKSYENVINWYYDANEDGDEGL